MPFVNFRSLCWVVSALVASGCTVELQHELQEDDANDIYVLLQRNNIDAKKTREEGGNEPKYVISVSKADVADAAQLLREHSLPRPKADGLSVFKKNKGMIPTATEERAMFLEALGGEISNTLNRVPGVLEAQGQRVVPVRMRVDQRYRDTAIFGFADAAHPLRGVATWPRQPLSFPPAGVVLSEALARALHTAVGRPGDLELLEGDRRHLTVNVSAGLPDVFGLLAYAPIATLAPLLGEEGNVSSVLVRTDPTQDELVVERFKKMPRVLVVTRRKELLKRFWEQTSHVWVSTTVLTLFGAVIAFGVVYNQARVALSMRGRDLATLRVLGFTRREVSSMLLSELAFYVLVGLPFGLALGKLIVMLLMGPVDPETYRLPPYMSLRTYAFAALITILAGVTSALLVRRRLDRLDLIAVLKTRE